MKPYLLFLPDRQEMSMVSSGIQQVFKRIGRTEIPGMMNSLSQLKACADSGEEIRVLVCDATVPGVLGVLEQLRRNNAQMKLVLVADGTISPVSYIKPSILPTSLLWRPMAPESAANTLSEVLSSIPGEDSVQTEEEQYFTVEMRGVVKRYLYGDILFFEAREKRLVLHLQRKELPFPGTLEKLSGELPEGFIRVHKSFIVNRARVKEIQYGQNTLILDGGELIPISRSYKAAVKAVFS